MWGPGSIQENRVPEDDPRIVDSQTQTPKTQILAPDFGPRKTRKKGEKPEKFDRGALLINVFFGKLGQDLAYV